jgi:hypothetical protein
MELEVIATTIEVVRKMYGFFQNRAILEKDIEAIKRLLWMEMSHTREMVRMLGRIKDPHAVAEAAGKVLSVPVMEAILANSGAHAKVVESLGDLKVALESEEEQSGQTGGEQRSALDVVQSIVLRVRGLTAIGRSWDSLCKDPANLPVRLNVRLANLEKMLHEAIRALATTKEP